MALPLDEKLRQLRDPAVRAEWNRLAQSTEGAQRAIANWGGYRLLETFSDAWKPYEGRIIGDIARELGREPWDLLCDIVARRRPAHGHRQPGPRSGRRHLGAAGGGVARPPGHRRCQRRRRAPRHDRQLQLQHHPARAGGARARADAAGGSRAPPHRRAGRALRPARPRSHRGGHVRRRAGVRSGHHRARSGVDEASTCRAVPGRVYGEAEGVHHVVVNGVPCVEHGELLAARPGRLLRSGTDTHTVTVR